MLSCAAGSGRSSVTVRPLPSNIAERGSTERNIHPESLSPSLTPVELLSASLKKIAIRLFSPMIVPTKVKGGVSGAGGCTATVGVGAGAAATVGVRGRRDAEKSGRSRVAESFEMGMAHKGFPVVESSSRRASGVGRRFSAHVGPGAFRLDCGKRDRGRLRLGQACDLARKNCDPGDGERLASHWDSRHCPDTTTRTRIGAPSASPKACGACIARFSTKRYGMPASRS